MVKLCWARYKNGKNSRYLLAFHLGIRDGRHCLLECQKVSTRDVEILKICRPKLDGLSLGERIALVKELCPMAMKLAYRQIDSKHYEEVQQY